MIAFPHQTGKHQQLKGRIAHSMKAIERKKIINKHSAQNKLSFHMDKQMFTCCFRWGYSQNYWVWVRGKLPKALTHESIFRTISDHKGVKNPTLRGHAHLYRWFASKIKIVYDR